MVIRISAKPVNGTRVRGWREDWAEPFIPRLARAEAEGRTDSAIVNAMLRRGKAGRIPRHQSLSEMDGDWN